MRRLNFCLFCEYSLISKEGTPSFIGVFSEIIGKKLPLARGFHIVVSFFPEDRKAHEMVITLKSPLGEVVKSLPPSKIAPASSETSDIGLMSGVAGLKFEKEGMYHFEFLLDGEKIGEAPLTIKLEK